VIPVGIISRYVKKLYPSARTNPKSISSKGTSGHDELPAKSGAPGAAFPNRTLQVTIAFLSRFAER
jgi:hypothetical protein